MQFKSKENVLRGKTGQPLEANTIASCSVLRRRKKEIMETQQVAKNSNPSFESDAPHVQSTSGNAHDGTSSDFECGGGRSLVALADARCLMRHVSTTESSLLRYSETTLPCQQWIIEQNIVAQKSTSWHTVAT